MDLSTLEAGMDEYEGMDQYEEYEHDKKKYRFSPKQYEMLKRCSDKKDMTEWNEWRGKDIFSEERWSPLAGQVVAVS